MTADLYRRSAVLAAATSILALAAGCGGGHGSAHPPTPATGACARLSARLADDADQILLHYGAQSVYPADVSYITFKGVFVTFTARRCPPAVLGRTLDARLTRPEQAELLSHLPAAMEQSVRSALRAGRS